MRFWWFLLGACNWTFGLDTTQLPGPDAAPVCTLGGAPPFSRVLHQAVVRDCTSYTIRGTRAAALCDGDGLASISEGVPDGPLASTTITPAIPDVPLHDVRLTPEGDVLISQHRSGSSLVASLYRRGETRWELFASVPFAGSYVASAYVGTPSAAPNRRFMVTVRSTGVVEEIEAADGAWMTRSYAFGDLGAAEITGPINLSADGLRVVFPGLLADRSQHVFYASRRDVAEPFAGGSPLDVPFVPDPFMTEDCSRIYIGGVGSIFYVLQQ